MSRRNPASPSAALCSHRLGALLEPLEWRLLLAGHGHLLVNPVTHTQAFAPIVVQSSRARPVTMLAAPPSSYDLRAVGGNMVTPVKNQGNCGSCWAFATYGSLESSIRMEGGSVRDLSENNLKNRHGFDWGPCDGGNTWISEAYLSRWSGPADESADPYHDWDDRATAPTTVAPQYYVREMLRFDTMTEMKNALMAYGALNTSLYWTDSSYNASNSTYYYSGTTGGNHAVTIVGWDDAKATAGGAGAWLIKNSWGSGWGNAGYFWLSYQDSQGGKYGESFRNAVAPATFSKVYAWDNFGDTAELNSPWGFNAFTATSSDPLKSVGFFTEADNASYTARIYSTFSGGTLSGLLATASGTQAYAGWHTVDLPSLVPLATGQKFYVYLNITNGGAYPLATDYAQAGYNSASTAAAGQSYYSFNGSAWTDLANFNSTANFCIKAMTAPSGGSIAGQLVEDRDTDGALDTGEPTLNGQTIYLDSDNDGSWDTGESLTSTTGSGNYAFTGLAPGTYHVRQLVPAGYLACSPTGAINVTLSAGQSVSGQNFYDFPTTFDAAAGNTYYLRLSGTTEQIWKNATPTTQTTPNYQIAMAGLGSSPLTFNHSGGGSTLTADFALGSPIPPGGMAFGGPATTGNTLAITNLQAADTPTATASAVSLAGRSINFTGAQNLSFGGAGTTTFTANASGLNLAISGGWLVFSASQTLAGLNIGASAHVRLASSSGGVNTLSLPNAGLVIAGTDAAPTGYLDLANNALLVQALPGGSDHAAVASRLRQLLQRGRAGGAWTGAGISSSAAAATAGTALGYADSGTQTTVKYTWMGDTNLDRAVNFDDLLSLSQHYGMTSGGTWATGDFDYSGTVDFDDLLALSQRYGAAPAGL